MQSMQSNICTKHSNRIISIDLRPTLWLEAQFAFGGVDLQGYILNRERCCSCDKDRL
jgi:hypothetical protein